MEKMAPVNIDRLLDLSPHAFEVLTGQLFEALGYKVEQSKPGRDGGVDLRLKKDEETAIAQCKRYRGQVGEPIVRDFFGAMGHEKVARGFIVTTGMFSLPAQTWAAGKPIVLVDGLELMKVIELMTVPPQHPQDAEYTKKQEGADFEAAYEARLAKHEAEYEARLAAVGRRRPYLTGLTSLLSKWLHNEMQKEQARERDSK